MPKASEVIPSPTGGALTDYDIFAACPACGRMFLLGEAYLETPDETTTIYSCPNLCPAALVIVSPSREQPETGGGHAYGEWMVRNRGDILVLEANANFAKVMGTPDAMD